MFDWLQNFRFVNFVPYAMLIYVASYIESLLLNPQSVWRMAFALLPICFLIFMSRCASHRIHLTHM